MTIIKDTLSIAGLKDPEVFIALKRLCSFLVNNTWQTSSTNLEYEFAVVKSKQYEIDIKMLAEIDTDIAWGQMKRKTKAGNWFSTGEGDFNPWYEGDLTIGDFLDSIELLVDIIESTTPQYLPEIEFRHYYHYLLSRLPTDVPVAATLQFSDLHQKIQQYCRQRYDDGHYADSILTAYKVVFNEIKDIADIHDLDGKQLAEKAFSLSNPIIKLNGLANQSEKDEQLGFMLLFSGAAVGIRNPKAHDLIEYDDKHKALRYLTFASLLIERLDERKAPL